MAASTTGNRLHTIMSEITFRNYYLIFNKHHLPLNITKIDPLDLLYFESVEVLVFQKVEINFDKSYSRHST